MYALKNNLIASKYHGLKYPLCAVPESAIYGLQDLKFTHILSLREPGYDVKTPDWLTFTENHIQFQFHDVTEPVFSKGVWYKPATVQQIKDILAFGQTLINLSESNDIRLVVHCAAGVSRSTAVTYALLCQQLGPGLEGRALTIFKMVCPYAWPNEFIIEMADKLLNRRGAMINAIKLFKVEARTNDKRIINFIPGDKK